MHLMDLGGILNGITELQTAFLIVETEHADVTGLHKRDEKNTKC